MYLPAHFAQPDASAVAALLAAHPLAAVVWSGADGLVAEHLPLLWDRGAADGAQGTLRGHVARANPVWRGAAGQTVLAVFQGAQGYVSPSWYPSKREHGKVVPTWNYDVVHLHGTLRTIDDEAWLHALVSRLTAVHEAGRTPAWQVDDAPADYLAQMRRAIVGIEIEVIRLQAKRKVSQNRSADDRAGVAAGFGAQGTDGARAMAALVRG